ncbi:MAG: fatty acid desaturase [Planctomycetales bacterium]|nr:fatty acid desaturase [Planctomycetales bacterium]
MLRAMFDPSKELLIEAHRPTWTTFRLWLLFTGMLAAAEGLTAWSVLNKHYALAVVGVVLAAHFMHSQLMAFHEAAHGVLCPPRWLNETVGIIIGNFHLNGLTLFRNVHSTHHAYLGTEKDEQLWPFVDTSTPRWLRRGAAIGELCFGMFYDAVLFWTAFARSSSPIHSAHARWRVRIELASMIGFWAAMIAATVWLGTWKLLLWLYILPSLVTGSMYALRKYIEHMGLMGRTPAGLSRSVVHEDPLGKLYTFTMFNIGYHGVHHAYSAMPQHSLPKFTGVLADEAGETETVYPNYRRAFWNMLPSLRDPRIGSQWLAVESEASRAAVPAPHRRELKTIDDSAMTIDETAGAAR